MTNKNGADETLSSFAYTYAADGNILTEVDHTGATTTYTYDLLGRLICGTPADIQHLLYI